MTPRVKFDMRKTAQPGVIVEYVDDPITKQRVGVLVAKRMNERTVRLGWGFADLQKGDTFSRDFGLKVAFDRIEADRAVPFHPRFHETVTRFCERANHYFKTIPEFPGDSKLDARAIIPQGLLP